MSARLDKGPLLVLGSASPRRAALLQQLGLRFVQVVSPIEELTRGSQQPAEFVVESACAKARAVSELVRTDPPPSIGAADDFLVIGADTVVSQGETMIGKPTDSSDAVRMLQRLSGRTHDVYTGLATIRRDGGESFDYVVTQVRMRKLSEETIRAYVATGEPLDKAGSYAIQGLGALFVERISGCYYNVVGLPLARLCTMLEEAGVDWGSV